MSANGSTSARFRPCRLGSAALALGCALPGACATASGAPRCAAGSSVLASDALLIGEGEAEAAQPGAAAEARQRALAAIAGQLRVEVRSTFSSRESESSTGASREATAELETRATAALEGVEPLETCEAGPRLRVRLGLDRARAAAGLAASARAFGAAAADGAKRAAAEEAGGRRLAAVGLWFRAAAAAREAGSSARAAAVLARSAAADPPEAVSPARLDAEARAALGRARLRVVLESSGATNAAGAGRLLEQAASSCLAAAGLPIGEGGDGVLALRAVFDPALQVAPGLSVVRGHLSVALHGAGGESVTGEEGAAKGGGATPELARAESERKLAAEVLPGAVDKALDLLGWPGLRKCAR